MHELRGEPELTLARGARAGSSPCDLVLVEGYKAYPIPKLEIWRPAVGKPLLHPGDPPIVAIATDAPDGARRLAAARVPARRRRRNRNVRRCASAAVWCRRIDVHRRSE